MTVEPWQAQTCTVTVTGPRHLIGGVREHLIDIRVVAFHGGSELREDVRLTFRQRPVLSGGLLFAIGLILVLVIWGLLAYLGLRAFAGPEGQPLSAAPGFWSNNISGDDAGVTVSGKVLSEVDESPVSGVTVLACSLDRELAQPRCTRTTADDQVLTDTNGRFWLAGTFPGPYRLRFLAQGGARSEIPDTWYVESCELVQHVPPRPGDLALVVTREGAGTGRSVAVKVEARLSQKAEVAPKASGAPVRECVLGEDSVPIEVLGGLRGGLFRADAPDPSADLPAPSPEAQAAWSAIVPDGPSGWKVTPSLTGLPAPGHYDLTITAGDSVMQVCDVPVTPGRAPAPLPVEFVPNTTTCPASS